MARVSAGSSAPSAPEPAAWRMMEPVHTEDGVPLFVRHWRAPGGQGLGTIVIVHGLGEHIGRYDALVADLNAAQWNVCGYDHRGHGASGGARGRIPRDDSLLRDLGRVLDQVREVHPGPVVLLGHSLGGAVAARFVAEGMHDVGQPPSWYRRVDALILSSPALQLPLTLAQRTLLGVMGAMAPDTAVNNGLDPAWISSDPQVVERYRRDPLVHDRITPRLARFMVEAGQHVRQQASVWAVPTLLMWAMHDRCVDPAGSLSFANESPREYVAAQSFSNMAHEIFNEPERERPLRLMLRWLQEPF